jgi:hypothetical protein
VQVREDTPPPVARRLFVGTAGSTGAPEVPAQSRQRKENRGLRSLCCGLFPRRRHHATHSPTVPSAQCRAPMTQRHIPATHTAIPEEDEDEDEDDDQENQPPIIVEHLMETDEHDTATSNHAEQEAEQEMVEELNVGTRTSVRHSWVTVSRWLE